MDKGFNLSTTVTGRLNFLNAQLTSKYRTFHTCSYSKVNATAVSNSHLGAGMQRQLRHDFTSQTYNAQILNDNTINTNVVEEHQVFSQLLQLTIIHQGIYSNINTYSMHMGKVYSLSHFLFVKIAGVGTSTKGFTAHINSIGTCIYSSL